MIKKIKYLMFLCLSAFLILSTTACSSGADSDEESVTAISNNDNTDIVSSALPKMYITCDTAYHVVSKESYTDATVSIEGTSYEGSTCSYQGNMQLKVRGNSTAIRPKKPYKIKFDEKVDLFGMGKSKHWVLLANDIDHTHMRNKLLYDLSGALGDESYMESTFIDVYYNNEYIGIYQLCEHIRVGKTRINILDWDDIAEDAATAITTESAGDAVFQKDLKDALKLDYSWIDEPHQIVYKNKKYTIPDSVDIPKAEGGFVLEMDFYSEWDWSLASTISPYRLPLYFNTPEPVLADTFINTSLYNYAYNYITTFEYALHSDDFIFRNSDTHYFVAQPGSFNPSTGWSAQYEEATYIDNTNNDKHYSELFTMDSLLNNFIICEYSMNWDSMKNSFHIYKDIDKLAVIGPQWDFDWAFGNINMYNIDTYVTDEWHTTNIYFTNEQYYQSVQWNTMLIRDPYFLVKIFEKYNSIRPTLIEDMIKTGGTIDTYQDYLSDSAIANDKRWIQTYAQYHGKDFITSINSLKSFITERVSWLDAQFKDIDTLVTSLGCYKTSDKLTVGEIKNASECVITADINDTQIQTVTFQINGTYLVDAKVNNGKATVTIPQDKLVTDNSLNVVEIKAKGSDGKYMIDEDNSKPGNYNLVISNFSTF